MHDIFLLADSAAEASASGVPNWPDPYDRTLTALYLAIVIGLPLAGYVLMYLDYRRYLRSLRRAMVVVVSSVPSMPYWALKSRPECLKILDLSLPCTEEDVMIAYREKAKSMHPDRGGGLDDFLRLQRHFEQALQLVRRESEIAEESEAM